MTVSIFVYNRMKAQVEHTNLQRTQGKFSKKVYEQEKVDPIKIDQMLKNIQFQYPIVQVLNGDILQNKIFPLLGKAELRVCSTVCKQFRVILIPLFIQEIRECFKKFEKKVDDDLSCVKQNSNSLSRGLYVLGSYPHLIDIDIKNLKRASRRIETFKGLCVFLMLFSQKIHDLTQVKDVLLCVLKLQQACDAYISTFQFLRPLLI